MDVAGDLLPAANEAAIRALENGSLGLGFSGAGFLLFYVSETKGEAGRREREEGGLVASLPRRRRSSGGRPKTREPPRLGGLSSPPRSVLSRARVSPPLLY